MFAQLYTILFLFITPLMQCSFDLIDFILFSNILIHSICYYGISKETNLLTYQNMNLPFNCQHYIGIFKSNYTTLNMYVFRK